MWFLKNSGVLTSSRTFYYLSRDRRARGGGALPIMACKERLRSKGVPFYGFRYVKGQGFYLLKYIIWVIERAQRANWWILWLYQSRKRSIFVTDSCLNDSAFFTGNARERGWINECLMLAKFAKNNVLDKLQLRDIAFRRKVVVVSSCILCLRMQSAAPFY